MAGSKKLFACRFTQRRIEMRLMPPTSSGGPCRRHQRCPPAIAVGRSARCLLCGQPRYPGRNAAGVAIGSERSRAARRFDHAMRTRSRSSCEILLSAQTSFGNLFRDACNAAGVKKSAHGVRKIGAIRAALNGATVAELDAIFWLAGRRHGRALCP
jgi:hypothetical protein